MSTKDISGNLSGEISGSAANEPRAKRPVRDWRARTRESALDSLRHTRFVDFMKRALPVAASVLVAVVLVYAVLPRQSDKITMIFQRLGHIENDLAMMRPRLTGTDAKGNPFVITADRAVQDLTNPHRARLFNIEADITIDNKQWLNTTASKGAIDVDAGSLYLTGGISLFSDSGYEIHTATGHMDLHRGIFVGPGSVTGQGPLGNFSADRFEINQAKRMIYLNGDVLMKMYPGKSGVGK